MVHFIWKPQIVLSKLSTGPDVTSLTHDLSKGIIRLPPELAAGGRIVKSAESKSSVSKAFL